MKTKKEIPGEVIEIFYSLKSIASLIIDVFAKSFKYPYDLIIHKMLFLAKSIPPHFFLKDAIFIKGLEM
ncbi:MAG: hypothetical protein ABIO76_07995 [Ginsengibacter sp.]